jgi:16S rRNA (adenine1518-N6/adenine1519-N6)-dimethyltransferase
VPRAKRRLGQHFLTDPRILARIAEALSPGRKDTVLEIGPGVGSLTAALVERAGRVVVIEKDRDLIGPLQKRVPHAEVIEGDALDLSWNELVQPPFLLTGNIPYNITSPLLDKALQPPLPERVVFLVQKEVADRVNASAGTSQYGALTVGIQVVAQAERLFTVPAGAFHPRPKVDSAVLRLAPRAASAIPPEMRRSFRTLVVGLFGFRRKQLVRALRELTGWEAERIRELVQAVGLPDTARPEVLEPLEFVRLHRALVDAGWDSG